MVIQICVGSSCHLKGSEELVTMLQDALAKHHLENEVDLCGSFCTGHCNRVGVTLQVDDEVVTGVTPASFNEFFQTKVLAKLQK